MHKVEVHKQKLPLILSCLFALSLTSCFNSNTPTVVASEQTQSEQLEAGTSNSLGTSSNGNVNDWLIPLISEYLLEEGPPPVNQAPDITSYAGANPATDSIEENTTLVIDLEATDDQDSEGNGLTWSITGGADSSLLSVDSSSGVLVFNTAPDFEKPGDSNGDNIYELELTVSDSEAETDSIIINITVTDDVPVITSYGGADSVNETILENTTFVHNLDATDDQDGEGAGLTWLLNAGLDDSHFSINTNTGVLRLLSNDFENPQDANMDNIYEVLVSVMDSGRLTDSITIEVKIKDTDDIPVITSYSGSNKANDSLLENTINVHDLEATDDEDTEGAGLTWEITAGDDSSHFNLGTSTGFLKFNTAPDFETPQDANMNNVYEVTATVTDSDGQTDSVTINVTVIDVANEPIYVDIDATGTSDGLSWENAFSNLQDALQCLRDNDPECQGKAEVWVAEGTYFPDVGATVTNNDSSESFYLVPDVAVYGGFDGTETLRSQRNSNPATNNTILSGDIDDNDNDPNGNDVIENVTDIVGNNANNVVYLDAEGLNQDFSDATVLDGFTITAGKADGTIDSGAGLYCNGSSIFGIECSVKLRNLDFVANIASEGPAVYHDFGEGVYNQLTLKNNQATDGSGGAMYIRSTTLTINNSNFKDNHADGSGGALYATASTLTINHSDFSDNQAIGSNSSSGYGGAIFSLNTDLTLYNTTFLANHSSSLGGAITQTGGIANYSNLSFYGNTSDSLGGAVQMWSADGTLTNILFSGNKAYNYGGALSFRTINTESRIITIINSTFSKNLADADSSGSGKGGSIYIEKTDSSNPTVNLDNSILWDGVDSSGNNEVYNDGGTFVHDHSTIENGTGIGIVNINGGVTSNQGDLRTTPPQFKDSNGADNIAGTTDDDLTLFGISASSALDSGDNALVSVSEDLAGNVRIVDGPDSNNIAEVDRGAYEFQ